MNGYPLDEEQDALLTQQQVETRGKTCRLLAMDSIAKETCQKAMNTTLSQTERERVCDVLRLVGDARQLPHLWPVSILKRKDRREWIVSKALGKMILTGQLQRKDNEADTIGRCVPHNGQYPDIGAEGVC